MTMKPDETPEWGSDLSNVTAPSLGQRASGWTEDQIGVSSYENWKAELTWRWLSWLSERSTGEGYPSRLAVHLDEQWADLTNDATAETAIESVQSRWDLAITIVGGGSPAFSLEDPSFDLPARSLKCTGDAAATTQTFTAKSPWLTYIDAGTILQLDAIVRTGPTIDVGTSMSLRVGIETGSGELIELRANPDTSANWRAYADHVGTTVDEDSGVAVAVDTTYRLKVVIEGNEIVDDASDYQVTWYIDGEAVHTTKLIELGGDRRARVVLTFGAAGEDYVAYFGPTRCRANVFGIDDAP